MPDLDDLWQDRLSRMPLILWVCTISGTVLGVVVGVVILTTSDSVRGAGRLILGGLICGGFVVGLAVGCLIDLAVKSRRQRKAKGKRSRRRIDRRW